MYNGYETQDDFHKALAERMDDYANAMQQAINNGTYATGWAHANCDHAYDYCQAKG